MHSMTGYGSSSKKFDNKSLDIELKSVNSKFFDLNIKSNINCFVFEKNIRKLIGFDPAIAVAVSLVSRVTTLWVGVALGVIMMLKLGITKNQSYV